VRGHGCGESAIRIASNRRSSRCPRAHREGIAGRVFAGCQDARGSDAQSGRHVRRERLRGTSNAAGCLNRRRA
jgi:hypothetical protein